jgi:hypothetical protein
VLDEARQCWARDVGSERRRSPYANKHGNRKDHVPRVAILPHLTIDRAPDPWSWRGCRGVSSGEGGRRAIDLEKLPYAPGGLWVWKSLRRNKVADGAERVVALQRGGKGGSRRGKERGLFQRVRPLHTLATLQGFPAFLAVACRLRAVKSSASV